MKSRSSRNFRANGEMKKLKRESQKSVVTPEVKISIDNGYAKILGLVSRF